MKKGFTLIELLAVILILGIIALIAVPQVTNVIDNASKGAAETSAEHYIGAINTKIGLNKLDSDSSNNIKDGRIKVKNIVVDMTGETPTNGVVYIYNGSVASADLEVNGRNVRCDNKGRCIAIDKYVYYNEITPYGPDYPTLSLSNTLDNRPNGIKYIRIPVSNNNLLNPQACLYYEDEEICFGDEDYEVTSMKIIDLFEFNESTWTQDGNNWYNPGRTVYCQLISGALTACANETYQVKAMVIGTATVLDSTELCGINNGKAVCNER